jgi:predicted PurR-regulated permease PerM
VWGAGRIVALFLLIAWCIGIILPFVEPVIWGAIVAVVLHPFFVRVRRWVGNRDMLAGVLVNLLIFAILLLPTAWLVKSLIEGMQSLCTGHSETASPEKAQEAGIRAFLMKPLMRKELAETVRRVLDHRKAEI